MSYGTSSINVEETSLISCSRLQQRRNGLANIFCAIDPTSLKTNGWGEWSESNDDSDTSEIEDDECQTNQTEESQSANIKDISSSPRHYSENEIHKLCKEIFVRQLSLSNCAQRKNQYLRTFSIGELYSNLDSCYNRRRRNACPHVLDSITDWELKNLKHMFVSTVHEGLQQLVCF